MKNYLLLFLINPLIGILNALKSNKTKVIQYSLFIYILFIGATFIVQDGTDIEHYYTRFAESHQLWKIQGFDAVFEKFIASFIDSSELFMPIIILIGSIFSDSTYLFTFIVSFFVAIAVSNCYKIIRLVYLTNSKPYINYLIICLLFFFGPAWSINGRFWLTFWFFLYILLKYLNDKKFKTLLYLFPLILIHNGFILAILIVYLYYSTHQYIWSRNFYIILIIGSYVFSVFAGELILEYSSLIGGGYEKKAVTYAKDVVEYQAENNVNIDPSFIVQRNLVLSKILPIILLFSYFYLRKIKDKKINDFYNFILLFYSFSVFFYDVPSLGGRYWFILSFITLLFFLYIYYSNFRMPFLFNYLNFIVLFFCIYVGIRFELVQTSFGIIIGNVFLLPFIQENNMSMRDFFIYFF